MKAYTDDYVSEPKLLPDDPRIVIEAEEPNVSNVITVRAEK
jgi:hypothetical protein